MFCARGDERTECGAIPLEGLVGRLEQVKDRTQGLVLGQVADNCGWRVAEGQSHGPACATCVVRHRCEGRWREYPDEFGRDESSPVTGMPAALR